MQTTAAVRATAWDIISGVDNSDDGMTRAAAQVTALAYLLRDASTSRSARSPSTTLPACCKAWSAPCRYWPWDTKPRTSNSALAQWNVKNEYHVQDMLGVILAPYFPDLDDEEWLKSLGQHHPRADFAIPSLNLIIEVKFLRQGTTSALSNLIQEVAADASSYLQEGKKLSEHHRLHFGSSASTEQP